MFDFGVNSGNSRAVKYLQRLLGVEADGAMSDAMLAALRGRDAADLAARLCDARLAFLKGLKTWPVFGAGWGRRVVEVRAASMAMARASQTRAKDGAIAAGGVVAAGAVAHQAHATGMRPAVIAAVAVILLMLAVGGWLAWRWWRLDRVTAGEIR